MTDTPGTTPPFPGFPGFPPAEMLESMWGMMRLSPFGSAFSGAQPGSSLGPSLSMMSDMMAPLTNVEELDKRITDMRAVEQWLKLNLNMLQSAIQALEVQRATLATLRAFGAFAQSSMAQPASAAAEPSPSATGWPHPQAVSGSASASSSAAAEPANDEGEAAADAAVRRLRLVESAAIAVQSDRPVCDDTAHRCGCGCGIRRVGDGRAGRRGERFGIGRASG